MSRMIEGENRHQAMMFPERVDDYVEEGSVVCTIKDKTAALEEEMDRLTTLEVRMLELSDQQLSPQTLMPDP